MRRALTVLALSSSLALGVASRPVAATPERAAYAPFVGSWHLHGFSLEVTAGGTAYAVYRAYVWCGAEQQAGCDRMVGDRNYAGGLWSASLHAPAGGERGRGHRGQRRPVPRRLDDPSGARTARHPAADLGRGQAA